jgi:hypothetical protein
MRSEFVEYYLHNDDLLSKMIGTVVPSGARSKEPGRRIDWRQDAGEGAFLERQLESIEGRIYEYKLRELKFRRLFPVSNEGAGAETIAYDIVRNAGMAKIIASGATDVPRADTFVSRHYAVVRPMGISFGYTTRELRNAAFSNVPLEARRGAAARRGMEEGLSQIAWYGDTTYNVLGLFTNPNITAVEAGTPAEGSSKVWGGGDKTPLEVIKDITDAISAIRLRTNEIHQPNTLVLPVDKYDYLMLTPYSDRVPMTLMRFLTDPLNKIGLDTIEAAPELSGSGLGSSDQMLVYERSDEVMQFRIPMELRPMPPEQRGLEYLINMESEVAGLVIRYPLALQFTYGI